MAHTIELCDFCTAEELSSVGGRNLIARLEKHVVCSVSVDKGGVVTVTSLTRNVHVCSQEIDRQNICRWS